MKTRPARSALTGLALLSTLALTATMGASVAHADEPTPGATTSASPTDDGSGTPSTDAPTPGSSDSAEPTPSDEPSTDPTTGASDPATDTPKTVAPTAKHPGPPNHFTPHNGIVFNYPYSGRSRADLIRLYVLKSIQSVPYGGSIRIAMFSINDDATVNALIAAVHRHVSVQVVVNEHNVHGRPGHASSPSFKRLSRALGTRITAHNGIPSSRVSFAKYCHKSCRGIRGNVHYKMVLLSSAGGTDGTAAKYITMTGSPNLTMLAARGQWNHMVTFIDPAATHDTYEGYLAMFNQMRLDRPAKQRYVTLPGTTQPGGHRYTDVGVPTWFYPKPVRSAGSDPMMTRALNTISTSCKSATGRRTDIYIGQYAWFDTSGYWKAKKVRSLWDHGCNVRVEYAVMSNTVKRILYSSRGRGRIPMRQVGTYAKGGTVLTYDHAKWLAVKGRVANQDSQYRVWTGTTNWTNLGFASDDFMTEWSNADTSPNRAATPSMYSGFVRNFGAIWKGPHAFTPSPRSAIPGDIGAGRAQQLTRGKYINVEDN